MCLENPAPTPFETDRLAQPRAFRKQLEQNLDELGRSQFLPWGLPDPAAQVIQTLGGGRSLKQQIRAIDTILDKDLTPVRSRMQGWVSELKSSTEPALEESIVFYRERDGRRALKAYHTRDLRLQQVSA